MTGATIVLLLVLMIPGHPPVPQSAPVDSIEECLEGVKSILEQYNPEWPNGTRLQAGCIIVPADKSKS